MSLKGFVTNLHGGSIFFTYITKMKNVDLFWATKAISEQKLQLKLSHNEQSIYLLLVECDGCGIQTQHTTLANNVTSWRVHNVYPKSVVLAYNATSFKRLYLFSPSVV